MQFTKESVPKAGKVGFTCSTFDLLHPGHMMMLEEAKATCNYLIVGLQMDPTIDRPRTKNKPIWTIEERRIMLRGNRYIDEVFEYSTEAELYAFLKENARSNGGRIDVRIIGEEYRSKPFTGSDLPIPIFFNSRGHDYSTTNLRRRVYEAEASRLALA